MKFKVDKVSGTKEILALVTDGGEAIAFRGRNDESFMICGPSNSIYVGCSNFPEWVKMNPSGIQLFEGDAVTLTL